MNTEKKTKDCCSDNNANIMTSIAIFLSLAALILGGFALGKSMQGSDTTSGSSTTEAESGEVPETMSEDDPYYKQWKMALETYNQEMQRAQEEASRPQQVDVDVSIDDDAVKGDANAPITIVEFSDFECPYCGRHFTETYPQLDEEYVQTGRVKYVFRDFPLGFHENAIPAAVAANCAREQGGDETYFSFHDKLFADQQNLNKDAYLTYAEELSLDTAAFESCYDAQDTAEIEKDMQDGQSYGVSGTPAFFIYKEGENPYFISGAYPFEAFAEIINGLEE